MKNKNLENLINDIKKTSLTSEEKSVLFAKLNFYADSHQYVRKSPYFSFFHIHKTMTYVIASVLVVILAGGGTISASAQALPGDILYPVKIKVAEPLRVVLAKTPEAKEKIEVAHIEERLNEAEILAVEGRLASTTAIEIKQRVDDHIKILDNKLSKENKDNLDIKMSAHSIVLKNIKNKSNDNQKSNIETIEKTVVRENRKKPENDNNKDNHKETFSAKVAQPARMMVTPTSTSEQKVEVKVLEGKDAEREIKIRKEVENIDKTIEKRTKNDSGRGKERQK